MSKFEKVFLSSFKKDETGIHSLTRTLDKNGHEVGDLKTQKLKLKL